MVAGATYGITVMTAIAQALDKGLKKWRPQTARMVRKLVSGIIERAEQDAQRPFGKANHRCKADPFLNDTVVWRGKTPKDLALHHDQYLYGNRG